MSDERIHRVLDGELAREALSASELRRLERYERVFRDATATVERADTTPTPDVAAAVMSRLRAMETQATAHRRLAAVRDALAWLWTPRPIRLRPAYALAAVAVLALSVPAVRSATDGPALTVAPAAEATREAKVYVHFRLDAPTASSVQLAGDFTDWQPRHTLHEVTPGVWTVVVPLEAGVHEYAFVVDGEQWRPDPLATPVDDGFGGQNSLLSILPPEEEAV